MKSVYIVLMHTNTFPSKIIKFFTHFPYTHVGISLDIDCSDIYSFGRKKITSFLHGGFTIEKRNGPFFQKFYRTNCQIYEIKVHEQEYFKLKKLLQNMKEKENLYKYDILGLVLRYFHLPYFRNNRYVCSYFVADILKNANILEFTKETYFVRPQDFSNMSGLHKIYEGKLLNYHTKVEFYKTIYG